LHAISEILGSSVYLKASLERILEVLADSRGSERGVVLLLDQPTGELNIEAATRISWQTARRTSYKVGEGIVGRVVESGRPIVVPRVSQEPLFLNRTGVFHERGEVSFFCVPIKADARTIGALGAAYAYDDERDYEREQQFLSVVASMLGQAARLRRLGESEQKRLVEENQQLRQQLKTRYAVPNIIGNSHVMQALYQEVGQVAPTSTTVLILGESGTGKELIAHAIHYGSSRADKPFVKVSCAALPESLIEAELFGHEKGAFTDAVSLKKGRFELAHKGTLFLDEIGELQPQTQIKLLRVLQEREFERLGGVQPIKVDVRLIAATNRDLEAAVRERAFREDLYYRLNVFTVFAPPLRERKADVLLLADHFVEKYAAEHRKDVRRLATTTIDMLMAYHWPGNVRELENCIERAVLVCDSGVIHAHHLPPSLQTAEASGTEPRVSLEQALAQYERDLILDALKTARGNQARAARLLDTTERIVGYKLRKHGIDPKRFRADASARGRTEPVREDG
jgi:Nif-specific regulatory protein